MGAINPTLTSLVCANPGEIPARLVAIRRPITIPVINCRLVAIGTLLLFATIAQMRPSNVIVLIDHIEVFFKSDVLVFEHIAKLQRFTHSLLLEKDGHRSMLTTFRTTSAIPRVCVS